MYLQNHSNFSVDKGASDEGRGFSNGGDRVPQLTPTPRPYPVAEGGSAQRPPTMTFTKRPSDFNHRTHHHQGQGHRHNPYTQSPAPETTVFGARIPQPTANPKISTGEMGSRFDGAGGGRFPHFPERSLERRGELPPNFQQAG